jgi:NADH:ubiquinone oxidoreductase subunit 5 (subunit L)/multisubunit Na+/H+ antiporter MnhA subunit
LAIFAVFKSLDYLTIFSLVPFYTNYYFYLFNLKIHGLSLIGVFLFIGAMGKSAQLGLHT